MMRRFLLWLSARLPEPRLIYDREGRTPYLSRWYLLWHRSDQDPVLPDQHIERKSDTPAPAFNLFLHRFHRSDDDGALHSHPWAWAISLVLAGGYSEERRVGFNNVIRRTMRPGMLNFLSHDSYHRVDLIEDDAWSLFLVGPQRGTWYFWDRDRNARCPWRDFILARRGYEDSAPWEPSPEP